MTKKRAAFALGTAVALAFALPYLMALLMNAAGTHWFSVWGVNGANLSRAPAWLSLLYTHYAAICAFVQNIVLLPAAVLSLRFFTRARLRFGRGALWGAFLGIAAGFVLFLILRISDLVRPGYAYLSPRFSASVLIGFLPLIAASLGGEAMFRGLMIEAGRPFPDRVVDLLSACAFALLTVPLGAPVLLMNTALIGFIGCGLYRMSGGIGAGFAFRLSLMALLFPILGFEGGVGFALYETYARALPWLSGGAGGPLNGLVATGLLAGIAFVLGKR